MKKTFLLLFALLGMALANGQGKKNTRVGLFTSLYLDSAFDALDQYKTVFHAWPSVVWNSMKVQ